MSVQSPTDAPPPEGPIGPPSSDWTPAPLSASGSANYAGKTNLGQPAPSHAPHAPQIGRYAPRRTLGPLLIALIGVIAAVLVAYTALNPGTPSASPSPTDTPSRTPSPSASPRDGTPFTVSATGTTGVWKIIEQRWDDQGLAVLISLTVDTGDLTCYFNALPNNGQETVRGETTGLSPPFPSTVIAQHTTATGWVYFAIPRSTTLVFLRTVTQAQISGIEVAG
jgi:hypothetical protein